MATKIKTGEAEATAELFKALSDPQRVTIFNLLANSDDSVCVCDITASMELSQATISFHLKKLTAAGLVMREQRGTWAYYSVDRHAFKAMKELFSTNRRQR